MGLTYSYFLYHRRLSKPAFKPLALPVKITEIAFIIALS